MRSCFASAALVWKIVKLPSLLKWGTIATKLDHDTSQLRVINIAEPYPSPTCMTRRPVFVKGIGTSLFTLEQDYSSFLFSQPQASQ